MATKARRMATPTGMDSRVEEARREHEDEGHRVVDMRQMQDAGPRWWCVECGREVPKRRPEG